MTWSPWLEKTRTEAGQLEGCGNKLRSEDGGNSFLYPQNLALRRQWMNVE
jgi:hypothetical protein